MDTGHPADVEAVDTGIFFNPVRGCCALLAVPATTAVSVTAVLCQCHSSPLSVSQQAVTLCALQTYPDAMLAAFDAALILAQEQVGRGRSAQSSVVCGR